MPWHGGVNSMSSTRMTDQGPRMRGSTHERPKSWRDGGQRTKGPCPSMRGATQEGPMPWRAGNMCTTMGTTMGTPLGTSPSTTPGAPCVECLLGYPKDRCRPGFLAPGALCRCSSGVRPAHALTGAPCVLHNFRPRGCGSLRHGEEEEWEREKELEEDEENGGTILVKKQRNRRGTREDHPRWSCS